MSDLLNNHMVHLMANVAYLTTIEKKIVKSSQVVTQLMTYHQNSRLSCDSKSTNTCFTNFYDAFQKRIY